YKQAEFDNYRKNVMKEKTDLILNGGKKVLESMLPVVDDFELALQHMGDDTDANALREGVELILKKFLQVLKSHGVEAIDTTGKDFDTDFHEAIAQFPAPAEELKGKVVDCTKKGYTMNGKVLRFAQVVVGV
ncbi:MAG: nucleotide exchange factor GrpE, partial [Bacteroidaceae bacterium]|nr:nucleotide exchange factor GrpE [Bacteroidaceae bacterium]